MLVTNFIFNSKHALCNILQPFVLFQASNADKAYLYASFFSFVSFEWSTMVFLKSLIYSLLIFVKIILS